jgi:hypothetical protein
VPQPVRIASNVDWINLIKTTPVAIKRGQERAYAIWLAASFRGRREVTTFINWDRGRLPSPETNPTKGPINSFENRRRTDTEEKLLLKDLPCISIMPGFFPKYFMDLPRVLVLDD